MERTTCTLIYYLRKTRIDKDGKAPIYVRLTVNGRRAEVCARARILPQYWDQARGKAVGNNREGREINRLLQEGRAKAVLAAGDLLDRLELAGAAPARQARPLSAAERQVLTCLTGEPRSLEALAAGCGLSQPELAAVLMQLSLAGYLRELPGQQYSLL